MRLIRYIGLMLVACMVTACGNVDVELSSQEEATTANVILIPSADSTKESTSEEQTHETTEEITTEAFTTEAETTEAEATEIEKVAVGLSAQIVGEHYIGDILNGRDFLLEVEYSDGSIVDNPEGWNASPLVLEAEINNIVVNYDGLSTEVVVEAKERPTEPVINAPQKDNYVVVLDPGHGGADGGATNNFLVEKEMTLKVANYLRDYLLSNYSNVSVILTREEDTRLELDETGKDLKARCRLAANAGADIMVSLHFNTSPKHNANGATVIVSQTFMPEYAASLGNCVLNQLSALGLDNLGNMALLTEYGYDYYAINRHCAQLGLVGVIIEHCFIDNGIDVEFCDTDEELRALAEADARGIAKYLNLK